MQAEYLALDGSLVTVEGEGRFTDESTAAGWAVVPSLLQAHPFTRHPRGHSHRVVDAVKESFDAIEFLAEDEFSVKNGELRVYVVRVPTATGRTRTLTVGAWEGHRGCLATSLVGESRERLVEVFETLQFEETDRGVVVRSPVTVRPRTPEVITEVENVGVLAVVPAVADELERVPRAAGHRTEHGELFRTRAESRSVLFVGRSALARLQPLEDSDESLLELASRLRVEWHPPARRHR